MKQSWSTTEPRQPSAGYTSNLVHPASQHMPKEDRHLWTLELSTKDTKESTTKEKGRSRKGKSKGNKGKGYGYGYNKGKGKIGQGMPFKGALNQGGYIGKGKGKPTGKGKGVPTQGCYRCGQPGHIARDCRVAVHNLNEATGNTSTYTSQWQEDPTAQWYQQQYYDGQWWNDDQTQVSALPQQQLALPPPSAQEQQVPQLHIAAISIQHSNKHQPATEQTASTTEELMIDSGAQPPQRQKGSNTCSASTTFCHNNSAELPCDFTASMYIFNMSCPHWPVVQGLESTLVDNVQTECVQQQKAPTAAARQQCLKHLALLHGSRALPYQGHLQATAVNNRQRA